jgi:hypothetical protein
MHKHKHAQTQNTNTFPLKLHSLSVIQFCVGTQKDATFWMWDLLWRSNLNHLVQRLGSGFSEGFNTTGNSQPFTWWRKEIHFPKHCVLSESQTLKKSRSSIIHQLLGLSELTSCRRIAPVLYEMQHAYIKERIPLHSGLESREYGRREPSRWPRGILYPQVGSNFADNRRSLGLRPHNFLCIIFGARGSVVVKALCYKPGGRGFDTLWGEFLNLPNPSVRTRSWGLLGLQQKWVPEALK